jgi:hypothetical protein
MAIIRKQKRKINAKKLKMLVRVRKKRTLT